MVLTSLLNQQLRKISKRPKPIRNASTGFVILPCSLEQLLQLLLLLLFEVLLILLEEISLGLVDGVHGLLPLLPEYVLKVGLSDICHVVHTPLQKKYLRPGSCRSWSATI